MARIRSIHPDFPSDKKLAQVGRDVRLTYVECWCIADDKGLFRAERRQLLGQLYPYDTDVDEDQLEAWLSALVKLGVLVWRTTRDGMRVGELVNFPKRQKIDRPSISFLNSELVPLAEGSRVLDGAGANDSGGLPEPPAAGVLSPEPRVLSPEPGGRGPTLASVSRYSELRRLLPEKAYPALDGYVRAAKHPNAVVAAILDEGPETGINAGPAKTWLIIGQALQDLLAAGETFTALRLRAFIGRLVREAADPQAPGAIDPGARMKQSADEDRRMKGAPS